MKSWHNFLEEVPFHYLNSKEPIMIDVSMEGKKIAMELDTGSGISTMSRVRFEQILPRHELYAVA